jgi:hypothetical protein
MKTIEMNENSVRVALKALTPLEQNAAPMVSAKLSESQAGLTAWVVEYAQERAEVTVASGMRKNACTR